MSERIRTEERDGRWRQEGRGVYTLFTRQPVRTRGNIGFFCDFTRQATRQVRCQKHQDRMNIGFLRLETRQPLDFKGEGAIGTEEMAANIGQLVNERMSE